MKSISLNGTDWLLVGYWQHFWKMGRTLEGGFGPLGPAIPARVPGAVHADLLVAGQIPDWQNGLDSAKSEWVNNREWELRRNVTVPVDFDVNLMLECDGLDYSGHLLIDGQVIADFEGTHLRHRFDLTGKVAPGQSFELSFLFDIAPQLEGQVGYTSRTRISKPRFGYCWDWTPRLVNVGIWQDIRLVSRGASRLDHLRVLPRVEEDLKTARLHIAGLLAGPPAKLLLILRDAQGTVVRTVEQQLVGGPFELDVAVERVELWWPAPWGPQSLYELTLEVLDQHGRPSDSVRRTIGFKRVRWLQTEDSPADAEPYLCEINGCPISLRGINWVPLSPLYGTVDAQRYAAFLRLYRDMNVNLLRVWGGGILETPTFYEQCDQLGLLVWQEFPLSSSGLDNWPPEDAGTIAQLQDIAREYVERRAHHACHLLWCGGNELQGALDGGKAGIGKPVDSAHPLMIAWRKLIGELDPGKRFLCTSPTGPRFYADAENFGKGLHHMVHGPWANLPLEQRYDYFNRDDALLRPEVGAPGAASLASLHRHCGDLPLWPPSKQNIHWRVPGAMWAPWDDVVREFGPIADDPNQLPVVVKASRYLQAESYRYVAESVRRRFPRCGGLNIWMGHDCIHCAANNSLIQVDGSTKPAYDWLQRAWARRHVSLEHDSISYPPGEPIHAQAWVHDDNVDILAGILTARLYALDGRVLAEQSHRFSGTGPNYRAARLKFTAPDCRERLFVIHLEWQDGNQAVSNRYLLSQQRSRPLAPLLELAPVALECVFDGPSEEPTGEKVPGRRDCSGGVFTPSLPRRGSGGGSLDYGEHVANEIPPSIPPCEGGKPVLRPPREGEKSVLRAPYEEEKSFFSGSSARAEARGSLQSYDSGAVAEARGSLQIHNPGPVAAIGVRAVPAVPDTALLSSTGNLILLPGETQSIQYELLALTSDCQYHSKCAVVVPEGFNLL